MENERRKPMLGKVILAGTMSCETGLHIGAQGGNAEIGGMDNPVVRDPVTRQPYVPGSSLKGKLRALLERSLDKDFNHRGAQDIYRHECTDTSCKVCRLMGSSGKEEKGKVIPIPARLLVRDLFLTPESVTELERIDTGLLYTEWKVENNLDRITSAANPRPMERVPAGAEFRFEIIYTVEAPADVAEDLTHLFHALALLEDDALGGSGSRGYGKVRFQITTLKARGIAAYGGDKTAELVRQVVGRDWPDHAEALARYFAE